MNPQSYRNPAADPAAGSPPGENRSTRERGVPATHARPPPAVPYRRYPSLSDDGQPYFPRLRRARWSAEESAIAKNATRENERSPFVAVRTFALLVIVALVAFLVASA